MPRIKDITGQRFGRLVVLSKNRKNGKRAWQCLCDCGNHTVVTTNNLNNGSTQSCGCLFKEQLSQRFRTHGEAHKRSFEYSVWSGIKTRCTNNSHHSFRNYGGRGITICERWADAYENFLEDMGRSPSKRHSIERLDNDGPYCKENCKWATRKEQRRNTRQNHWISFEGKTMLISDWAHHLGITVGALLYRLRKWSLEKALTEPSHANSPKRSQTQ